MIESGGTIQFGHDRRQLDSKPPLVCAPSNAFHDAAPVVPPARHKEGERLDDEHAVALRCAIDEALQQAVARFGVVQFVDGECGEYRAARHVAGSHIAALRTRRKLKLAVRPRGLRQRPRMAVDCDYARRRRERRCPGCSRSAGAAAEINQRRGRRRRRSKLSDDFANK